MTMQIPKKPYELPVNTPSPNTQRFLVLQISPLHSERKQSFYFILAVPVDPPQYYWPLLHVSRFRYSINRRSQARHNLLSNRREDPAKIRIVAGRRFWRFLLVNQLPLSIMSVHAQYRATVPLNAKKL